MKQELFEFLKLFLGLLFAMCANVLIGSTLANLKTNFNKKKMISGIYKAGSILFGISFLYLCSYLNPKIFVLNLNGLNVNAIKAMQYIFGLGITTYGYKSLKNIVNSFKLKIDLISEKESETIEVKKENFITFDKDGE